MKRLLYFFLAILPLTLTAQGTIFFDNFSGPLDTAWVEFGTTGRVFTDQGRLVMDYRQDLPDKPGVRRRFPPVSNLVFLSFLVNAERNWLNAQLNLLNSQQDTVAQLVIDEGNGNGFFLTTVLDPSSGATNKVKVSDGFTKNQDYRLSLEIDLGNQTLSVAVDGVQTPDGTDVPFLLPTPDLAELEIYQQYMFNSNNDTLDQNLYFDDFQLSETNKSLLAATLNEANEVASTATIGGQPGQYPQSALNTLVDSITAAQLTFDDPTASQADVDQATTNLEAAIAAFVASRLPVVLTFDIDTNNGHALEEGMSGFNLRLIDNTYTYTHPEFQQAIDTLQAGWLRYFSGTTGDSYNARTGYTEIEWADQMVKEGESNDPNQGFFRQYKLNDAKGPYRLHDLYQRLGDNEAKLIITFNAFTDDPEGAAALAKFCHDNQIIVEDWQLCNEPYFFIPDRGHYFYQHGLDYATRVEVVADSIRANYPGAKISLNAGWDHLEGFGDNASNGIKAYGTPYWNILGKHSYSVFGQNDDFSRALTRMNGGLAYLSQESMDDVYDTGWPQGKPVHITEWNTFNSALSGTYMNGLYAAEYLLRMLDHEDVRYLGHHRLSSSAGPRVSRAGRILDAYEGNYAINPDTILEGLELSPNGYVFRLFNAAINRATFRYASSLSGSQLSLPANNQNTNLSEVEALFAQALRGDYGYDYALFTNKANVPHDLTLNREGNLLTDTLLVTMLLPEDIQSSAVPLMQVDTIVDGHLRVPAYAIVRVSWKKPAQAPLASRIYRAEVLDDGVRLKWWQRENADGYRIHYGLTASNLDQTRTIIDPDSTTADVTPLNQGLPYFFEVEAFNAEGDAPRSNQVSATLTAPAPPELVEMRARNGRINAEWNSVPGASGYRLLYGNTTGNYADTLDLGNVLGARLRNAIAGQTYYGAVIAYNGQGVSAPSPELSVTPVSDLPYSPALVNATENAATGTVTVSWIASDSAYGGSHILYRSTEPYGPWEEITRDLTGTSYSDASPLLPGTYYYALKTANASGVSQFFSQAGRVVKVVNTVGIDPLEEETGLNPFRDNLDQTLRQYDLAVFDLMGRWIWQDKAQARLQHWVQAAGISQGVYIWQLTGITRAGQFVKQTGKFRKL